MTAQRRRTWSGRTVLLAICTAAAAALVAIASPAHAADADPGRCTGSTVGHRLPVLLIHGFTSSSSAWDDDREILGKDPNVCVDVFNYGVRSGHPTDIDYSTQWVTNPNIGEALAGRLKAMSHASTQAGGKGRIVVVGHSLGGLALRCALDSGCSHGAGGAQAVSTVRAAVTFDTPHRGTELKGFGASLVADVYGTAFSVECPIVRIRPVLNPLMALACHFLEAFGNSPAAKAFTPGSAQLAALAPMPSGLPVMAVAGQIAVTTSIFGKLRTKLGDVGDLVVSGDSAQTYGHNVGGIGGTATIDCGNLDLTATGTVVLPRPSLTCWHGSETTDSKFLATAQTVIRQVEAADHIVTQTPISTVDVTGYDPDATYHVNIWSHDETTDCSPLATGAPIAAFLTGNYCKLVHRVLASTTVNGHPVAISAAYVNFGNPPGSDPAPPDIPSYGFAAGFERLVSQDGTGSIRSLLADGKQIPGNNTSDVPDPDAFTAQTEDGGAAIFDLWYLDEPTPANDPALVSAGNACFLQVY